MANIFNLTITFSRFHITYFKNQIPAQISQSAESEIVLNILYLYSKLKNNIEQPYGVG